MPERSRASSVRRIAATRDLNGLPNTEWRVNDDGIEMGVVVRRVGGQKESTRLLFLRLRHDALHLLNAARQLTLWQPPAGDEFSELTHAVIWPDNFMAAVTSRDAPNHKKLAQYFEATSRQRTHIVNLFNPDVVARLRELRNNGLRSVKVKVQTSQLQQIEQDRDVRGFQQLWNAGRGTEAATIGIELGVGRVRDARLNDGIAAEAEELAAMGDTLESMIVTGRDRRGAIRKINMKKERIRTLVEIPSDAADLAIFRAIEQARGDVENATGRLERAARGA